MEIEEEEGVTAPQGSSARLETRSSSILTREERVGRQPDAGLDVGKRVMEIMVRLYNGQRTFAKSDSRWDVLPFNPTAAQPWRTIRLGDRAVGMGGGQ